eukprot:Hpha_TRINITY_DN12873_c0_g1::TRINITY_DN12873_c0_g1_i1::g.24320::m.24320/K11068/hlyIII; hemolysin III
MAAAVERPSSILRGLTPVEGGQEKGQVSSTPRSPELPPEGAHLRPRWRGYSHLWAAIASVPLGVMLVLSCPESSGMRGACAMYALVTTLLFGVSGCLHTITWSQKNYLKVKRADHSMIYVFIAASYHVFSAPILEFSHLPFWAWTLAAVGVILKMLWIGAPKWLAATLYVATGWVGAPIVPSLWTQGSPGMWVAAMLLAGGIMFTVGALFYGLKLWNPSPGNFEFHEVFHLFIIAGVMFHWACLRFCFLPACNGGSFSGH